MKLNFPTLLFLIILTVSLIIRLQRLDYPLSGSFEWGDGTRDYLVANHILKYQELPLLGPFNLLNESGIRNSPLYFYLLALLLTPFNHILTLGVVNILLQVLVVVLIYLITKRSFNQTTALIAVTLFSFNPEVLRQSDFIWQPHLMQFFAYLSLMVLLYYPTRVFLMAGLLSVATALHNSAFAWLPVLLLTASRRVYLFLMLIVLIGIFFMPVFYYQKGLAFNFDNPVLVHSLAQYLSNLISNTQILLKAFNLNFPSFQLLIFAVLSIFSLTRPGLTKQKPFWLVATLVLLPIVFASFFNKIRLHYLILSMGPFCILTAHIISSYTVSSYLFRSRIGSLVVILLFLFFFKFFSQDLAFLKDVTPFKNQKLVNNIIMEVKDDLEPIKNDFQIRSYGKNEKIFYYPILDTILLVPLEKSLNQKLSEVSDNSPYNHIQTDRDQFLLLACYGFRKDIDIIECKRVFIQDNPSYVILKSLYEGAQFKIFLAS